jgi:palmitoyltransferase
LVLYFLLLVPYLFSYLRILQVVITNPGYIPQRLDKHSDAFDKEEKQSFSWACSSTTVEENAESRNSRGRRRNSVGANTLNRPAVLDGTIAPPPGIEQFYSKDVFVCDQYGLPIFCDTCKNWKPDRTHHCSEVGRCVRRMDHFCPWVGGVVSETSMKFFIQFTFYGTLFCEFVFGVMIWAIVDRAKRTDGGRNGNWIAIAAAAGLFGFIAVGMLFTTVRQQLLNLTTIEFLGRVYFMAVYLPSGSAEQTDSSLRPGFITYPLPRHPLRNEARRDIGREEAQIGSGSRTFAIIQSKPTDNPWDIGGLRNLKSVLGERYLDWILPINYSPSCFHDDATSDFPLGEDFERMKRDYGLSPTRRRRRRRRSHGSRHSSR